MMEYTADSVCVSKLRAARVGMVLAYQSITDLSRMYSYLRKGGDPWVVSRLYDTNVYLHGAVPGMEGIWESIKSGVTWIVNKIIQAINAVLSFIGCSTIPEIGEEKVSTEPAKPTQAMNTADTYNTGRNKSIANYNDRYNNVIAPKQQVLTDRCKTVDYNLGQLESSLQCLKQVIVDCKNSGIAADVIYTPQVFLGSSCYICDSNAIKNAFKDATDITKPWQIRQIGWVPFNVTSFERAIAEIRSEVFSKINQLFTILSDECIQLQETMNYINQLNMTAEYVEQSSPEEMTRKQEELKAYTEKATKQIQLTTDIVNRLDAIISWVDTQLSRMKLFDDSCQNYLAEQINAIAAQRNGQQQPQPTP